MHTKIKGSIYATRNNTINSIIFKQTKHNYKHYLTTLLFTVIYIPVTPAKRR